jgi:5-methylcytosine-specific restriction endonuclease McrA
MNRSIRLDSLGTLSDNNLVRQLESLRGNERNVLAAVLRHLVEMERRKLYLPRGYSSMFEFCTQHLKYSRSAAGRRIAVARTLAKYSALEGYLLSGEINLYALSLISGILTEENFKEVVAGTRNRSTREVEALVAGYRPARKIPDRVRPVCVMVPRPAEKPGNMRGSGNAPGTSTPGAGSENSPNSTRATQHDDPIERVILSRKYKFEFAANNEFKKKFERMKALLSGRYPDGISFEDLFMLLMDEYIERHTPEGRAARREKREASRARRNSGQEVNPDPRREKNRTRNIPGKVRDEVFLRDGGRCTFKGTDGKRCNSKWNLQIDHIVPFALGGNNSPGNLRLLCGKHNRLEAERVYGSRHMEKFKKRE